MLIESTPDEVQLFLKPPAHGTRASIMNLPSFNDSNIEMPHIEGEWQPLTISTWRRGRSQVQTLQTRPSSQKDCLQLETAGKTGVDLPVEHVPWGDRPRVTGNWTGNYWSLCSGKRIQEEDRYTWIPKLQTFGWQLKPTELHFSHVFQTTLDPRWVPNVSLRIVTSQIQIE